MKVFEAQLKILVVLLRAKMFDVAFFDIGSAATIAANPSLLCE